jgi:hypothetical protein
LISNFRRVLNVVLFLLGNSPASVVDQVECSETSAFKTQTPGNYPKETIQHSLCFYPILISLTTDTGKTYSIYFLIYSAKYHEIGVKIFHLSAASRRAVVTKHPSFQVVAETPFSGIRRLWRQADKLC